MQPGTDMKVRRMRAVCHVAEGAKRGRGHRMPVRRRQTPTASGTTENPNP
jgi:hypothetical protein